MTQGYAIQVLLTFILYLIFFGWIGYRRGDRRELIVLLVAVIGWMLLAARGSVFVEIANLGGKLLAFLQAGGVGGDTEQAFSAIGEAADWVPPSTEAGYLFFLWVGLIILTYVLTGWLVPDGKSVSNGWAILWGILLGLFYASVFLPRLLFLFAPTSVATAVAATESVDAGGRANIFTFVSTGFNLIWDALSRFWILVEPFQPFVFLLLLTGFLLFVYFTIRTPKITGWFRSK